LQPQRCDEACQSRFAQPAVFAGVLLARASIVNAAARQKMVVVLVI
jgi:hypothetical protein